MVLASLTQTVSRWRWNTHPGAANDARSSGCLGTGSSSCSSAAKSLEPAALISITSFYDATGDSGDMEAIVLELAVFTDRQLLDSLYDIMKLSPPDPVDKGPYPYPQSLPALTKH